VGETLCVVAGKDAVAAGAAAPSASGSAAREPAPASASDGAMRRRYSPAVLALAAEHGIRLDEAPIPGSGHEGRITRKDVLAYVESGGARAAQAARAVSAPPAAASAPAMEATKESPLRTTGLHLSEEPRIPAIEVERGDEREYFIDVTPVRNTIATRM